ncbi:MAG: AtpZ/AtpI family protein [Oceanicaulis sp.]|uniref:AtpZ/AtpI family protein n=1 Tax=Glycocaulis sp. TaxID=1969725 RepID=UPI0025C1E1EE|nr:AtpZ/AtpI family protein [Glycocaulis sp.]MCC5981504.1 AtpZ/AtpI family protein [Oceanicaulis sp.]MCH8522555.1 AtpZ/AtpI family protein [Glycocaulis sp.]
MSSHSDHTSKPDPDDFEHRLAAKLKARQEREAKEQAGPSGWSQGIRYGSEFFGGVLAGTGLGLLVDWFFGWSPFGLLTGVILGFVAGALNIVRAVRSLEK